MLLYLKIQEYQPMYFVNFYFKLEFVQLGPPVAVGQLGGGGRVSKVPDPRHRAVCIKILYLFNFISQETLFFEIRSLHAMCKSDPNLPITSQNFNILQWDQFHSINKHKLRPRSERKYQSL